VEESDMQRSLIPFLGALALAAAVVAPVGAKDFGLLYAEGETYRTFGTPAHVDPGTGTDPIYTFENATNPDQFSVAQFAPGKGSHGGRWAVYHLTWVSAADAGTLITDYGSVSEPGTLAWFVDQGRLTVVRDEAADFRCPILPNG
jgi:hypothetical protein